MVKRENNLIKEMQEINCPQASFQTHEAQPVPSAVACCP
jgi:hypothetical protein